MFFDVISCRREWEKNLKQFSDTQKDIYFEYAYLNAYERNGDGEALCAVFLGAAGMRVIYPFIKVKIPSPDLPVDYFDITSCYGYGGPLVSGYDLRDMEHFESLFHDWCVKSGVVAEFIRFHPFLDNHVYFQKDILVEFNRYTVWVNLDQPVEEIWQKSISGKNRNQIRKAQKSGIIIEESLNVSSFTGIYYRTMDRLGAGRYLYFSEAYFKQLASVPAGRVIVFEAMADGTAVAAALFFIMGHRFHYHLSGSLKEYQHLCPNNLLLYQAILYGWEKGLKELHLGGGNSSAEDDSLLKFKKAFSPGRKRFYTGKRVHNSGVYQELIEKWKKDHGDEPARLLQYHDL